MRFLVDECLSIRVADFLGAAGHDAIHVVDCGLAGYPDEQVLARAEIPSIVLFRRTDRSATSLSTVLLANLLEIADDLAEGAFVVITNDRIRIRSLPLK